MNITGKFFLSLSTNKVANKMAKKYGLKLGAKRFVAGDDPEHAVETVKQINKNNMAAMLNYLGEFVYSKEEATVATDKCISTIDLIYKHHLDCNLTVKITSLGLDISKEVCLANLRRILNHAKANGIFVRIEMEDYTHCQKTLDVFYELRNEYDNIGTVIQAYLYRAEKDIEDLNRYNANLRLVKGAYQESSKVAFPKKEDVDRNFDKIVKQHLINGNYAGIATHDDKSIEAFIKFTKDNDIPKDQFEFQMLYGIRNELQKELVDRGYKVRVYVPYGIDWFGYFMRRLAERPENVRFVLKNTFK